MEKMRFLIHNCPHIPSSISELKAAAFETWDQITEADIDEHVNHMGDSVFKAKGGHTVVISKCMHSFGSHLSNLHDYL